MNACVGYTQVKMEILLEEYPFIIQMATHRHLWFVTGPVAFTMGVNAFDCVAERFKL